MTRFGLFVSFVALLVCTSFSQAQAQQDAGKTEVRGWLSDESCGGGRARSGIYTGTNPICAKKCVREGKKMVLLDSDHRRVLAIDNPDVAMENIGDYVEIGGDLNELAKTLRIGSLKLLEKGSAMCQKNAKRVSPTKATSKATCRALRGIAAPDGRQYAKGVVSR
jgi:hypothetical protein